MASRSAWTSRFVDEFLYDVYRIDASVLAGADAALVLVAFVAILVPALRATLAKAVEILRAS